MAGLLDLLTQGSPIFDALGQYSVLGNDYSIFPTQRKDFQPYLEYWSGDETGDPSYPRPSNLPMGMKGVEVGSKARPLDILGDVVSHDLVNTDPKLKAAYQSFQGSLTDRQKGLLQEQYKYAQDNEGEKRPYKDWEKASGLPAYFRGYMFKQWPNAEQYYTPDQIGLFDSVMHDLTTRK